MLASSRLKVVVVVVVADVDACRFEGGRAGKTNYRQVEPIDHRHRSAADESLATRLSPRLTTLRTSMQSSIAISSPLA